jgi:hypothetical protein
MHRTKVCTWSGGCASPCSWLGSSSSCWRLRLGKYCGRVLRPGGTHLIPLESILEGEWTLVAVNSLRSNPVFSVRIVVESFFIDALHKMPSSRLFHNAVKIESQLLSRWFVQNTSANWPGDCWLHLFKISTGARHAWWSKSFSPFSKLRCYSLQVRLNWSRCMEISASRSAS